MKRKSRMPVAGAKRKITKKITNQKMETIDNITIKVILSKSSNKGGWDCYREQIAIDSNKNLLYRCSDCGNCDPGDWNKWEDELAAIKFLFGDIRLSRKFITELRNVLYKAKQLKSEEDNL